MTAARQFLDGGIKLVEVMDEGSIRQTNQNLESEAERQTQQVKDSKAETEGARSLASRAQCPPCCQGKTAPQTQEPCRDVPPWGCIGLGVGGKISGVAAQCRRPKNKDRGEQLTRNEAPKGDQKPPAGLGGREG